MNIPYRLYSMGICVHYICTECLDLQKNCISRTVKIQQEIMYNIYVRKVTICWNIEYPELWNFIGKLCTLYMYGMFGLTKKLNVQSCENSTENCVRYICMECLYLQRNWMSRTAYIKWQIIYIICTEYLDLQRNWISWNI